MPLSSLKILDFTYLLPGPLATMTVADLGADVLKIESPAKVDLVRYLTPFIDNQGSISCVHAFLNRNKRSVALDLKKLESKGIIERLIRDQQYDIVVEQFRPGVMARLGLSYEHLTWINPDIIYCSLTGYGQNGPLKDRAGHDINYLSMAGVMSYSGTKDSGPIVMGVPVADVTGSHNTVIGILTTVIHRMRTGLGQHVDVAMTDCMYPYHALAGTRALYGDMEPDFEADILNGRSLYVFYETADGRYLSFGGLGEPFSRAFLEALGLHDLASGGAFQFDCFDKARERVRASIRSKPLSYWAMTFKDIDACVEPVLSFSEDMQSEHAQHRRLTVDVPGPDGKEVPQIACPIKFSRCKARYQGTGCSLGRDSQAVIRSLGCSEADISALKSNGVFAGE